MKSRSPVSVKPSLLDRTVEAASWLVLAGTWILVLRHYETLPDAIPAHYGFTGDPTRLGGKAGILLLPLIGVILLGKLTVLGAFPHIMNYPVTITKENALRQYANAILLLRFLKLSIALSFGLITVMTIQTALGHAGGLGGWFLPLFLILVFVPVIFFLVRSYRLER